MLAESLKSLGKKGGNGQNREEFLEKEKGKDPEDVFSTNWLVGLFFLTNFGSLT